MLMEAEDPTVSNIIEEDLLELSINDDTQNVLNEYSIIGSVISDKVLNFRAIKSILTSSWNLGSYVQITALDQNLLACTFQNLADKDRILAEGPWAVKGHVISFVRWSPKSNIDELDFSQSPFWVQIHNLPLNRMNLDNAIKIGNVLCSFLEVDDTQFVAHKSIPLSQSPSEYEC